MATISIPEPAHTQDVIVPATTTNPPTSAIHEIDADQTRAPTAAASFSSKKEEVKTPSSLDEKRQSVAVDAQEAEYPTGFKFAAIQGCIFIIVILVALDQTIVSTAVPIITNEFSAFSDVGWYASGYLLTSTVFQPLFGRLYGSFSVKWTFLSAFLIFELGSLICAVAPNSTAFIVGRAIAGLGLAGAYSGSLIIISLTAPLHIRPLLLSATGGGYGIGATLGPIIGGALTSEASWRWCFYLNLFFIPFVVGAILLFLKVPARKHETTAWQRVKRIDWHGTLLALSSVICILLVFQWGGVTYAWNDSRIIGLIVGFVVIGAVFWADQVWMGEQATIPIRLFRNRTVLGGSIANYMIASSYFLELYFLPIYFQSIKGSSAIRSGVQTLPFICAVIFAVTTQGMLVNKWGHYIPIMFIGSTLMAAGGIALYFLEVDSTQATWVGLQFLAGLGPGAIFMVPFTAASAALDPADIEIGGAIVIFMQTLGGTISTSLAQSVFQNKFALYLSKIEGVDPAAVLSQGVSAFRATTPANLLPAVLDAANEALRKGWIMVIVFGGLSLLSVFTMDLKGKVDVAASKQAETVKKERRKSAMDVEGAAGQ